MKRLAFITEPRKHKALGFVLENFLSVLPKEWRVQINHGTNNLDYIVNIIDSSEIIKEAKLKNRLILHDLNVPNLTHKGESDLLKTNKFWDALDADLLLKFECDTILCPNSKYKISDFEKFNYIGGYWGSKLYHPLDEKYPFLKPGGAYDKSYNGPQVLPMNGALSIRNKKLMKKLVNDHFDEYISAGKPYSEDYFFSEYIEKPTTREVISFCIDNGYIAPLNGEIPFGFHKPWVNKGGAYHSIKAVCKEVEILESLQVIE